MFNNLKMKELTFEYLAWLDDDDEHDYKLADCLPNACRFLAEKGFLSVKFEEKYNYGRNRDLWDETGE